MITEAAQNRLDVDEPPKGRLLIVDDNRDFAAAARKLLTLEGYEVDVAHDGNMAQEALAQFDAEVVLLDLRLEAGSGLDLIAPLKRQYPGLVFVMMTGYADTEAAITALRRGAYDFLRKPIDDGELLAALERAFERIRLEEAKLNAEKALRQAQKMEAVGQLTGGVAHDFNNLLAVIQSGTELLNQKEGSDAFLTEAILRATARGAELTQRLLAFSRRQHLRPQAINLAELVSGMSQMLTRTLGETIEIEIRAGPELSNALADPGQVESALLNLALNARDAMPDGGKLTIECRNAQLDAAYVASNPEATAGDYVLLAVSDEGTGMTAEVRSHAFEPFFTTKEVGQGSGLGLSMVYGFAKQSGGHVNIYSEEGKGTTVQLYLART